jgi:hypothetical protein
MSSSEQPAKRSLDEQLDSMIGLYMREAVFYSGRRQGKHSILSDIMADWPNQLPLPPRHTPDRIKNSEDMRDVDLEFRKMHHSYQRLWDSLGFRDITYADVVAHFETQDRAHGAIEFAAMLMRRLEREGDETF